MIATASARLLRAILADPADDTARLAYSDALEEEGQDERAEFIRVQVGIERTDARDSVGCALLPDNTCSGRNRSIEANRLQWRRFWCASCLPKVRLLVCERKLLGANPHRISAPHGENAWQWSGAGGGLHQMQDAFWSFRRGFVAEVSCTAADFVRHAAALFSAHPIERVTLTQFTSLRAITGDLRHRPGFGDFRYRVRWWEFGFGSAGVEVMDFLRPGAGQDVFADATSAACVAYGRRLAGLPALD